MQLNLTRHLPWLVLSISLLVTYQVWKNAQREPMHDLQNNFNFRALEVVSSLDERLLSYEQVLFGVQALFYATSNVGSNEFRSYVGALHLDHNFPGIHGVTLALIDPSLQQGKRVVSYIEQFPGRSRLAFGYDVFADPARRTVMEHALDSGDVTVTEKLTMAPRSDGRRRSGFLMYVPIYRKGGAHDTLADRRANALGWAVGTFRMDDLMFGILGDSADDLDVEIFDGERVSDEFLLYDPDFSRDDSPLSNSWFKTIKRIEIAGHPWTLSIKSLPDFEGLLDKAKSRLIAETGLGISLLLALLTWLLVRGRASALAAAHEISISEAKLHAILDNSPIGIWLVGLDGRYRFVNKVFCNALGVTEQEFLSKQPVDLLGAEVSTSFMRTDRECLQSATPCLSRETLTFSDNKPHLLEITKVRLVDKSGMISGVIGIMIDITEATALQEALKKSRDEMEMRVEERTRDWASTAVKLGEEIRARKELERNILEISEEEQARIGLELHDDLGQLLTGAAYLAGSLSSKLAKTDDTACHQAGDVKKIIQDAIKRTRYISHGLVPFNIASQGLRHGLEQLAHDVSNLSGIPCEAHCSGNTEVSDFMIATHLYRIAQEAINNAVKHSSATRLAIELVTNDSAISLIIADNGVGLPASMLEANKGVGLMNMKYRAQIIGATIALEAQGGAGTKIKVTMSLA